jgi:hypothetical protein
MAGLIKQFIIIHLLGIKDRGDSNPGPLEWDLNRGAYVSQFMDRIPNGFFPLVNINQHLTNRQNCPLFLYMSHYRKYY